MKRFIGLALVAAFVLVSGPRLVAADDTLTKLLVEKGILTQEEVDALPAKAKYTDKGFMEKVKAKVADSLTIHGRIHFQWDHLRTDIENAGDPRSENSFIARRAYLGVDADLGNGWKAGITADFAAGTTLDKIYVSWKSCDYATLYGGFMKAPFGIEETTSSSKIKTVERSPLNRFFIEDLNWGGRVSGVHAKGSFEDLGYHAAVTNIRQNNVNGGSDAGSPAEDKMAYWLRLYYNCPCEDMKVKFGGDVAYLQDEAVEQYLASAPNRDAIIYTLYTQMSYEQFALTAQFMGATIDNAAANSAGTSNATDAKPRGFSLMPSFKINDEFEVVGAYTRIDSDGVGVDPSDATRRANDGSGFWDKYVEYYIGGNYYIKGNSIKLSAGYTFTEGEDILSGSQGSAKAASDQEVTIQGLRVRLQILF